MICAVVLKKYHDLRGISPSDCLWLSPFLIILHQFSDGRKYLAPVDVSYILDSTLAECIMASALVSGIGTSPNGLGSGFPLSKPLGPPDCGGPTYLYERGCLLACLSYLKVST